MKITKYILFLVFFAAISCWAVTIYEYQLNIPHWDDHAIKTFVDSFNKTESFKDKLYLLVKLHNEHRIATTRILSLFTFLILGTLNFSILIFLGNLFLIGLLPLLFRIQQNTKSPFGFLVCTSLLLFNFYNYENSLWGMASIQNYGILFFVFYALYFLIKFPLKGFLHFSIAILLTVMAFLTSGNGILLFPLGLLFLIIQKKYFKIVPWILIIGASFLVYFYYYEHRPDSKAALQSANLLIFIKGILVLTGSLIDISWFIPNLKLTVASIFGFVIISVWLILLVKLFSNIKIYKSKNLKYELFLHSILLFCFGTIFLLSYARYTYGLDILMTSKYKIYSQLISICIIALLLINSPVHLKNKVSLFFVFCSMLIFLNSYFLDFNKWKETYLERICENQNSKLNRQNQLPSYAYTDIKLEIDNLESGFEKLGDFQMEFDSIVSLNEKVQFFKRNNPELNNEVFLKFENKQNHKVEMIPMIQQVNYGYSRLINYYNDLSIGNLSLVYLKEGDYQLDFIVKQAGNYYLVKSNKVFHLKGLNSTENLKNW
jgi:hypothetical protein